MNHPENYPDNEPKPKEYKLRVSLTGELWIKVKAFGGIMAIEKAREQVLTNTPCSDFSDCMEIEDIELMED